MTERFCLPGRYPIDTDEQVKTACSYFEEHRHYIPGDDRVQYCRSLVGRAAELGVGVPPLVQKYASAVGAGPESIREALAIRMHFRPDQRTELDSWYKRADNLEPSIIAHALQRFDVKHGLDVDWEGKLLNPYEHVMADGSQEDEPWHDWIDGIRIDEEDLDRLVRNDMPTMKKTLSDEVVEELSSDPVGTFQEMSASMRRVVARLATDASGRQ